MSQSPPAEQRPVELGGGVSVTAITDAIAEHRRPIEECFPGEPVAGWAAVKERYRATVSAGGHWRLPINVFLVRTPELTLLVDAGVGCERTLAADVFRVAGTLPAQLVRHGVAPDDVNQVVFTHLHEDHIGWADDPDSGEPTFASATYHVHAREWVTNHTGQTPDWVVQALDPVERRGRLGLPELGRLTDVIEMVPLPGHTPGHVGLVITGPDARVALVGDAFNHPHQVTEPELPSIADSDRDRATATRHEILRRATSGEWTLLGSAHFPGAWWTVASEDGQLRETFAGDEPLSRSKPRRAPA